MLFGSIHVHLTFHGPSRLRDMCRNGAKLIALVALSADIASWYMAKKPGWNFTHIIQSYTQGQIGSFSDCTEGPSICPASIYISIIYTWHIHDVISTVLGKDIQLGVFYKSCFCSNMLSKITEERNSWRNQNTHFVFHFKLRCRKRNTHSKMCITSLLSFI